MTSNCSALVIFGVSGDLARKKLFSALYELAVLGELDMPVLGVGRSEWSTEKLRSVAAESIDSEKRERGPANSAASEEIPSPTWAIRP